MTTDQKVSGLNPDGVTSKLSLEHENPDNHWLSGFFSFTKTRYLPLFVRFWVHQNFTRIWIFSPKLKTYESVDFLLPESSKKEQENRLYPLYARVILNGSKAEEGLTIQFSQPEIQK